MPLLASSDPTVRTDVASVANSDAEYLIFYSSIDENNQMWCPDCRRVAGIVGTAFESPDAPSALIVYVGQRADWKENSNNPYRGSPWNIASVPTILRPDVGSTQFQVPMADGRYAWREQIVVHPEIRIGSRLVDDNIKEEALKAFMKA